MTYRIEYTPRAARELAAAHDFIAASSPLNAARWAEEIMLTIEGLSELPQRCPAAPEGEGLLVEERQLVFGTYRVLLIIEESTVHIVHIRHASRLPIRMADLLSDR